MTKQHLEFVPSSATVALGELTTALAELDSAAALVVKVNARLREGAREFQRVQESRKNIDGMRFAQIEEQVASRHLQRIHSVHVLDNALARMASVLNSLCARWKNDRSSLDLTSDDLVLIFKNNVACAYRRLCEERNMRQVPVSVDPMTHFMRMAINQVFAEAVAEIDPSQEANVLDWI